MNMSEHTPGPWTAHPAKDGIIDVWNDVSGLYVASTNGLHQEANARLIAAAPELLETAKKALDYFAEALNTGGYDREYSDCYDALSTAIALASPQESEVGND